MARLSPPRVRMPRVTLPGRASRAESERTTATKPVPAAKKGNGAEAAAEAKQPKSAEAKQAEKPSAAKPAPKVAAVTTAPDPNLQERMEGLQGWMAELERKQARTTYFGAVAILIAVAAAGAALYFGITNKNDSATKNDVDALRSRVDALQTAVTKSSKSTQDTINNSIAQLQGSIQTLQKQQAQNAASISTLQTQAQQGAFSNKAGNAAGTALTPGTTTTTPNKKP